MKFEQYLIESEIYDLKKEDNYIKVPTGKTNNLQEKQGLIVQTESFKKMI